MPGRLSGPERRLIALDEQHLYRRCLAELEDRIVFPVGRAHAALFLQRPARRLQGAALELLAALSHTTDFSVGCYCPEEDRCHRSILKQLLAEAGAKLA